MTARPCDAAALRPSPPKRMIDPGERRPPAAFPGSAPPWRAAEAIDAQIPWPTPSSGPFSCRCGSASRLAYCAFLSHRRPVARNQAPRFGRNPVRCRGRSGLFPGRPDAGIRLLARQRRAINAARCRGSMVSSSHNSRKTPNAGGGTAERRDQRHVFRRPVGAARPHPQPARQQLMCGWKKRVFAINPGALVFNNQSLKPMGRFGRVRPGDLPRGRHQAG